MNNLFQLFHKAFIVNVDSKFSNSQPLDVCLRSWYNMMFIII